MPAISSRWPRCSSADRAAGDVLPAATGKLLADFRRSVEPIVVSQDVIAAQRRLEPAEGRRQPVQEVEIVEQVAGEDDQIGTHFGPEPGDLLEKRPIEVADEVGVGQMQDRKLVPLLGYRVRGRNACRRPGPAKPRFRATTPKSENSPCPTACSPIAVRCRRSGSDWKSARPERVAPTSGWSTKPAPAGRNRTGRDKSSRKPADWTNFLRKGRRAHEVPRTTAEGTEMPR